MIVCKRTRSATRITFVLPFDEPNAEVSVVGDFNAWQPGAHVLTRSTYGTRAVTLTLPRDQKYAFRYVTHEGLLFDEPDLEQQPCSSGGIVTT